jgi:glutathione S-transferase
VAEGVDSLISSLRSIDAPDALFSIAATAHSLIANAVHPGSLLAAQSIILLVARKLEGEAMTAEEWVLVRQILAQLGDFLATTEVSHLDCAAVTWRAWTQPSALH